MRGLPIQTLKISNTLKRIILLAVILSPLLAVCQTRTLAPLCVQSYCKDTIQLPTSSLYLVAKVTTSDVVTSRGWIETSTSPAVIASPSLDSVLVSNLTVGNHTFLYTVKTASGNIQTATDVVTVLPAVAPPPPPLRTVVSASANWVSGVLTITLTFSDGGVQTITLKQ